MKDRYYVTLAGDLKSSNFHYQYSSTTSWCKLDLHREGDEVGGVLELDGPAVEERLHGAGGGGARELLQLLLLTDGLQETQRFGPAAHMPRING